MGPLLALGLVGILVTVVASPRNVPPESRDFIVIAVAAGVIGFAFLGILARVIWIGPHEVRRRGPHRVVAALALGLGSIAAAGALASQAPGLAESIGDLKNTIGLLFHIPALAALAGPTVIGLKYFWRLARPRPAH